MSSETLFDPARLPPRDECGSFHHPDLDKFEHPKDCEALDGKAIEAAGFDLRVIYWDYEDPDDYEEHREKDDVCAHWQPEVPEGWQMIALYDTEEGPAALMVRPAGQEVSHD